MRGGWLALCLAAAACNQVFGLHETKLKPEDADTRPDLDHDGIADVEDPCIAAQADGVDDLDGDGLPNLTDPCPLDGAVADADGDGIPDACDPFPMLGGDRHRCTMRFLNPDLNSSLWRPRSGQAPWTTSASGGLTSPYSASSLIATEAIEATHTTAYDVRAQIVPPPTALGFGAWMRAGDPASASDVGCELRSDGTTWTLRLISAAGAQSATPVALSQVEFGTARIRMLIEPAATGTNVHCAATLAWYGVSTQGQMFDDLGTVAAAVALPVGSFAVSSDGTQTTFDVLAVYERDDAP